jgi:hypothetical protein
MSIATIAPTMAVWAAASYAIKHQVRMLMADDRAKKAEEEARAQSTDIPQMKVGA